eukprot:1976405-Rhodomonas_salina.2
MITHQGELCDVDGCVRMEQVAAPLVPYALAVQCAVLIWAIALRIRCVMCSTDVGYAATRNKWLTLCKKRALWS